MTTKDIAKADLVYNGEIIHAKADMLSLTDMWKAAGGDTSRAPAEWLRSSEAERFIEFLTLTENMGNSHVIQRKQGRNGGTYAHWQIGLAYAKYLSPEFHMWCNTVVRTVMEGSAPTPAAMSFDSETRAIIGGIVKSCTNVAVRDALAIILPEMARSYMADTRYAIGEGVTAGDALDMAGFVDRKGMRGLSQFVSRELRRVHLEKGAPMKQGRLGRARAVLFDPLTVQGWLRNGGRNSIQNWIAERKRGQTSLFLVKSEGAA